MADSVRFVGMDDTLQAAPSTRGDGAAPRAEAYKRDLKTVELHFLDAGHFALETKAAEIASLMRAFLATHDN